MANEATGFPDHEGAERLRQLAYGYVPAALIGVIVELGIPDLLTDGMKPSSELAALTKANEDALYRILRTLAGLGIFAETGSRNFALTSTGRYLRSDVRGSLCGFIRWVTNPFVLRSYAELMHTAKTGEPAAEHVFGESLFSHLRGNPDLSRTFNEGMSGFSRLVSAALLETYDFSGIKVLADLAGGEGVVLAAILQRYPSLQGLLFEQEHVIAGARERLAGMGLTGRCHCSAVDFFDEVPAGADAYLMKSIIHDWDDHRAGLILGNCRRALAGVQFGKLLLVEPVIPSGNDPHLSKIIDMQMLAITGGRERTREEFEKLLSENGFRMTALLPTKSVVSLVEAVPE